MRFYVGKEGRLEAIEESAVKVDIELKKELKIIKDDIEKLEGFLKEFDKNPIFIRKQIFEMYKAFYNRVKKIHKEILKLVDYFKEASIFEGSADNWVQIKDKDILDDKRKNLSEIKNRCENIIERMDQTKNITEIEEVILKVIKRNLNRIFENSAKLLKDDKILEHIYKEVEKLV